MEVARHKGAKGLGEYKKGDSDIYKEYHDEDVEKGGMFVFKGNERGGTEGKSCSISIEQVKEVGELIGVSWAKAEAEREIKEAACCDVVDELWIEELWGGTGFGFSQLPTNGNSGGIIVIWDVGIFNYKEAIGDERFVVVKGEWKGRTCENSQVNVGEMRDFNDFINEARLVEIPMRGRKFIRISDDGMKFSKLDRFLVNEGFYSLWGNLAVLKETDFGNIVEEAWNVEEKIKGYKKEAMGWELEEEKRTLNESERLAWMEARKLWVEKENEYSSMLRQKARVRWDAEGDENSKFFHSFVKRRNNKNNIRGLTINEVWCEDPVLTKSAMMNHYKELF
nr:RNA-directed DNA polymerase, eukaryota, reverse transcriptase zinc-binding domain protein [Tanacetum cinerariifolium]